MSTAKVVRERGDYNPDVALEAAKRHPAYWQEDLLVTLADRLSQEVESQGMTRAALSRKLGVSPAYITKVLRGHENLTLKTLSRIAFELGKRWDCLLMDLHERAGNCTAVGKGEETTIKKVHFLEMDRGRNQDAKTQSAAVRESHAEYLAAKSAAKLNRGRHA